MREYSDYTDQEIQFVLKRRKLTASDDLHRHKARLLLNKWGIKKDTPDLIITIESWICRLEKMEVIKRDRLKLLFWLVKELFI